MDLVNKALGVLGLPVSEEPIGGTRRLARFQEAMSEPAETLTQEFAGRFGEEIGAGSLTLGTGVGVGAMMRAGANIAPTVVDKSSLISKLATPPLVPPQVGQAVAAFDKAVKSRGTAVRRLLEDLSQVDPAKLAKIETVLAGGAAAGGMAAQSMNELVDHFTGLGLPNEMAELAGRVAGSFGIALGPTVIRGIIRALRQKVGSISSRDVREQIGQLLAENMDDPMFAFERMDKNIAGIKEAFPTAQFTTAEVLQSLGLLAIQRGLSKDPAFNMRLIQMKLQNDRLFRESLAQVAPPGGTVNDVVESLSRKLAQLTESSERLLTQAELRASQRVAASQGKLTRQQAGEVIFDELRGARKVMHDEAEGLYNLVDPSDSVRLGVKNLRDTAKSIKEGADVIEKPEKMPRLVNVILDQIGTVEGKEGQRIVTGNEAFNRLRRLRTEALEDLGEARARPVPNRVEISRLERIHEAIEGTIDSIQTSPVSNNIPPDVLARYREASGFYKTFMDRFGRGTVADILRAGRRRELSTVDMGDIAGRFLNNEASAAQFVQAMGGRDAAVTTLKEYAKRDFFEKAFDNQNRVVASRMRAWRRKHDEALKQFPELRDEFATTERAQRIAEEIGGEVTRTRKQIESAAVSLYLNRDPQRIMKEIIDSKAPAREFNRMRRAVQGDPDAERGLVRAFWDEMLNRAEAGKVFPEPMSNTKLLNPELMRNFMRENISIIRQVYTPEQVKTLNRVIQAAEFNIGGGRIGLPRPEVEPRGLIQEQEAFTMSMMLSRMYAFQRGIVGPKWLISESIARKIRLVLSEINEREVKELLEEAVINPEAARTFIMMARGAPPERVLPRIRGHLAKVPLEPVEEDEE